MIGPVEGRIRRHAKMGAHSEDGKLSAPLANDTTHHLSRLMFLEPDPSHPPVLAEPADLGAGFATVFLVVLAAVLAVPLFLNKAWTFILTSG